MDAANCAAVLLSVPISYHFHGCTALMVALVVVSGAILNIHLLPLLLTVGLPRSTLGLSAKAFSVSAPSVWNSLTYNCRSAQLLSTFRCNLKTELFDIAYSEREHST